MEERGSNGVDEPECVQSLFPDLSDAPLIGLGLRDEASWVSFEQDLNDLQSHQDDMGISHLSEVATESSHDVLSNAAPASDSADPEEVQLVPEAFSVATSVHAALQSLVPATVEPIWQQGVWNCIFGDEQYIDFQQSPATGLTRPVPSAWESGAIEDKPPSKKARIVLESYKDVVTFRPDIAWKDQRDADIQSSMKFWNCLIDRWNDDCNVKRLFQQADSPVAALEMLGDFFARKSPVTLKKRGLAIARLCDYLEAHFSVFPCTENEFYSFLCAERRNGAPVSRLKGYLQAVCFVRHVLQVPQLQVLLDSGRCKGTAVDDIVREKNQASPLTCLEVLKLHQTLQQHPDIWTRVFSGAALCCLYARARWGDLSRAELLIIDTDFAGNIAYIEGRTGHHKTMQSQQHRHQFLPMVSPALGIAADEWASTWMELRRELNLELPPKGLFMPAPKEDGEASARPLESRECCMWLRKILLGKLEPQHDRKLSSHSLKATVLSWAAKRGLSMDLRLQLGYHSSKFQMGLTYSRDGAAPGIMAMEKMLSEIRIGRYQPDNTRSGRLVEMPPLVEVDQHDVIEVKDEDPANPEAELIESSENESSSSYSTSSEEERPFDMPMDRRYKAPDIPSGYTLWQHQKLKTLHLTSDGYSKVFECGRNIGQFHTKDRQLIVARFDTPICRWCFTHANKGT